MDELSTTAQDLLSKASPKDHDSCAAFNAFRKENPDHAPDLLKGFDAAKKTFWKADLSGLDLTGVLNIEQSQSLASANLAGATLSAAQLEALAAVGNDVAIKKYRQDNPTEQEARDALHAARLTDAKRSGYTHGLQAKREERLAGGLVPEPSLSEVNAAWRKNIVLTRFENHKNSRS